LKEGAREVLESEDDGMSSFFKKSEILKEEIFANSEISQ